MRLAVAIAALGIVACTPALPFGEGECASDACCPATTPLLEDGACVPPLCNRDDDCRAADAETQFATARGAPQPVPCDATHRCSGSGTCVQNDAPSGGSPACLAAQGQCTEPLVLGRARDVDGADVTFCANADVACQAPGRCVGGTLP